MKKIIKYFSLLVFCFIGMSIVKASTDIVDFKDEIFTFPSSYSNENADSNYVTSLKEGTLFSKWINIDNLSNYQSIIDNINTSCDPYYADLENEEKKTVFKCNAGHEITVSVQPVHHAVLGYIIVM